MKRITVLFCLFLFLTGRLPGQTDAYRFSRLNVDHGLSNNQIKSVLKDHRGFLWVGTAAGLNRYDGYHIKVFAHDPGDSTSLISSDVNKVFEGPGGKLWIHTWSGINVYSPLSETFDRNTDAILHTLSIPPGRINDIKKDRQGNFWFIHATEGLYRYSEERHQTLSLVHDEGDSLTVATNQIASLVEDHQGHLWVIHTNGVVEKIHRETHRVVFRSHVLEQRFRSEVLEYNLMLDDDGDLWFYISNRNAGIFRFKPGSKEWMHIDNGTARPRLNANIVRGMVQDENGILWIATDHGGINLLNKEDLSVNYLLHNFEDAKSLAQNSINVLYKDHDGIVWAGSFKNGISYYHKNINRFQLYRHQVTNPLSLPFNDVNAVIEDGRKNLWIGTNGGGLIYFDRQKNTYKQFLHDPRNANSLTTNVIVSLWLDRNEVLWIGTYFGGLISFDGKRFVRYKHDPDNPNSISDNSVWEILEDSQGDLWIGTLSQGVDRFDRSKNVFYHYDTQSSNPLHAVYVPSLMEDADGNLWIGTGYGIDVLNRKTGEITHYLNRITEKGSLSNNSILDIYQDSRGLIWIGTQGGLNLFDRERKTFLEYTTEDGLPHNSVLAILEDNNHDLWVSTPHGISHLDINDAGSGDSLSVRFRNYDEKDGLQGIQFNENAACRTSAGELVFGGGNGFNLFKPEDMGINLQLSEVILTDLQIFNKTVAIGGAVNGKTVLQKSIHETDTIVLDHSDNVFSIEFASVSQFHPEKIQYQYMLDGFDKEWVSTDASQRRVTYTNLDPGDYVFKVKAANHDGIWNETPTQLMITVLPPFWRSKTAFVLYALAMLGALLLARWLVLHNERINFAIQQEREKAHRMHELDMIKIKFFTNVSHEFRTPLTLILTPLEKMLRNAQEGEQKNQYQLIHRNARRLLNLVNQLLDFRKLEVQEIRLNTFEGDIVSFIREVFHSFSDLSEKNNIRLTFHTTVQQIEALFDQDKLEKIMFNLLSNAFKFTPEHGAVSIHLDVRVHGQSKYLEIQVKDTGIGIAPDKQEKIFERFFQDDLPSSMVNQGSGIGLSITREFVKVHGGTITVESEPGKGSCFTVMLPLMELKSQVVGETLEVACQEAETPKPLNGHRGEHARKRPVLLIVEDNEDFRFYLKDNLKLQYAILEARNGREGLERAIAEMPDLIVSDIMMPELNGIEMCKKIRNDPRTSHIPVVMLTARSAEEQKIEGFASGANDYVTKPFNFEILQSRIRNLIAQRDAFQRSFQKHIDVKAADVHITSLDEKLITKAIQVVEENMGEPDFSVEKFSRELGMSRVHLYKKLLALTGKSPIEFIRTIRLQRAAQLLEKSQLSVAEIAYKVGFNNPKYFSKYFKDQFKILPSAYANR